LKILVVGYGSIGKRHVRNLIKIKHVEILVCTKNKEADILKKNGIKIFKSLAESLKEKPDIGIICNETSLHVKTAIKLAKQDCHLFIEKALSDSLKNTDTLLNLIKKKKLITIVGCDMRFHKCIQEIKKIIEHGDLGKIISVRVENGSYLPDWHTYEDYRDSFASKKKLGGGVVLTLIHEVDYLYWFFGKVNEVSAITGKFSDLEISVEDFAAILLRFQKNIIAEVHLDYFQQPEFRNCKIIGTKGIIYWDSNSNEVRQYKNSKKKWITKLKDKNFQRNNQFVYELEHFLNCIKNHKQTINPIEDGINTLKISLAVKKSSLLKKSMHIKK
jgi:predicted dehydrogenase